MTRNIPRVSIGMPVYNGGRYLREALACIQAQTFSDFELIISDNASTDDTERICLQYAAKDDRIRYYRQTNNLGAGVNHNVVFRLSRGEYFKWFSHDDLCAPQMLEKCVETLDRNPEIVICYPRTMVIDDRGRTSENPYKRLLRDDALSPSRRFREMAWYEHLCFPIYGLIRSEILRKTPVMGCYTGGDNVLLARLALHGQFFTLPEYMFFNREHKLRSTRALPARMLERRRRLTRHTGWLPSIEWWDSSANGKISFPYWNMLWQYFRSIAPAPISRREKIKCYAYLLPWVAKYGGRMGVDLAIVADTLLAPLLRSMKPPSVPGVEDAVR